MNKQEVLKYLNDYDEIITKSKEVVDNFYERYYEGDTELLAYWSSCAVSQLYTVMYHYYTDVRHLYEGTINEQQFLPFLKEDTLEDKFIFISVVMNACTHAIGETIGIVNFLSDGSTFRAAQIRTDIQKLYENVIYPKYNKLKEELHNET